MKNVTCFRILWAALAMVLSVPGAHSEEQLDRLDLDSTLVKGNQELPRVLYIVPWKESVLGDLQGKPVNSLLDEVLAPLDRDVFQREVRYFDQLHATDHGSPQDE